MDAKIVFWTLAFVDISIVLGFAIAGVRQIRRGDVARHRRSMITAGLLVVVFLASYLLKVAFLGPEDMDLWSARSQIVLYVHETGIALMLLAGAVAGSQAWRMRGTRVVTRELGDPPAALSARRWHRRAGWAALAGASLAAAMAVGVLAGMYGRAGIF